MANYTGHVILPSWDLACIHAAAHFLLTNDKALQQFMIYMRDVIKVDPEEVTEDLAKAVLFVNEIIKEIEAKNPVDPSQN